MDKSEDSPNRSLKQEEEDQEYEFNEEEEYDDSKVFDWKFQSLVAKGSLSSIYLVKQTKTMVDAIAKVYQKSTITKKTFDFDPPIYVSVINEIDLMSSLKHPFIIPLIEVVDDSVTNTLILFMPYAPLGDLQGFVDNHNDLIQEDTFRTCFLELAEGMKYLHNNGVVHRDFKPENVLVFSETKFVISDFSVSSRLQSPNEMFSETKGPPAYLAPEELNGDDYYPKPADVWSYGIALFKCLFKYFPFSIDQGKSESMITTIVKVTELINTEDLVIPDNSYDPHAIEIIHQCLEKDPSKRPTFEDIVHNPWFDGVRSQIENEIKSFQEQSNVT